MGVLDIQDGKLDSALIRFKQVAESSLQYRRSKDVHTLATLAQARLHYEQAQWSEAIDCYQRISENSSYFPAVLYEMGWRGWFGDDSSAFHILCTLFHFYYISSTSDHQTLDP